MSGSLKTITDQFGYEFTNVSDKLGRLYAGETGDKSIPHQSGFTSGAKGSSTNYIAIEVVRGSLDGNYTNVGIDALFIHEMGNLIANQLGIGVDSGKQDPTKDTDYGQQLENCVFGGRVGLRTGRLGNEREFKDYRVGEFSLRDFCLCFSMLCLCLLRI